MKEEVIVDPALPARPATWRQILSWQAIFGGLVTTLAIELLLTVLALSIGVTLFNSEGGQANLGSGTGLAGAIAMIVISIISLFIGGWVAGRMSGLGRTTEGAVQGLVTWGAATLVMVCFVTMVGGGILGGMGKMWGQILPTGNPYLAQNAGNAGSQNMAQPNQNNPPNTAQANNPQKGEMTPAEKKQMDSIRQEARNIGQRNAATPTGRPGENGANPTEGASGQLVSALDQMFSHGGNINPAEREQVVNLLMTQDGMNRGQANQTVNRWIQSYKQSSSESGAGGTGIGETVNSVSQAAMTAGWGSFVALVLGAIAAMWGGSSGMAAFLRTRPKIRTAATPA